MQEVNNTETQQQTASFIQENNKVETTQTNLNEEKPKQNSFLITLLSILLLLACVIAGFFAYQTQTLVKELTSVRKTQQPNPTNAVEVVETPMSKETITVPSSSPFATNSAEPRSSTASPSSIPVNIISQ